MIAFIEDVVLIGIIEIQDEGGGTLCQYEIRVRSLPPTAHWTCEITTPGSIIKVGGATFIAGESPRNAFEMALQYLTRLHPDRRRIVSELSPEARQFDPV